ncbi:MAG: hypothetical protein V1685_00075 [Parcubacteria group bacterium]
MPSREFGHDGPPDMKRVVVIPPPEVPEGGRDRKSPEGAETEEYVVENAAGWDIYRKERHFEGRGDQRAIASSRQHFNSFDESGRKTEQLTQTLPDHPKTESQTRETHTYNGDERDPAMIRGQIEAGPDQGHQWETRIRKVSVEKDGQRVGTLELHTTDFTAQGNNPGKPKEGDRTTCTKFIDARGKFFGQRGINEKKEPYEWQVSNDVPLPPEGEWERLAGISA